MITPSVVRLSSAGSYCTGTWIHPSLEAVRGRTRIILTCAHFLRDARAPIRVGGLPVARALRIPRTDLALLQVDGESAELDLPRLSTSPAPWFSPAVTLGFGGRARQVQFRSGRVLARMSFAVGRNLRTFVTSAAFLFNRPAAVKGDSGAPVLVNGEIVAVQSMITDPFGLNTGLATVALVAPHRRAIAAAVSRLE